MILIVKGVFVSDFDRVLVQVDLLVDHQRGLLFLLLHEVPVDPFEEGVPLHLLRIVRAPQAFQRVAFQQLLQQVNRIRT